MNQLQQPRLSIFVELGEDVVVQRDRRCPPSGLERFRLQQPQRDRRGALLPGRSVGPQLASLELSLESPFAGVCDVGSSCVYTDTISWRTPTTPLPMEHNPRAVFERLFGEADTTDPRARLARLAGRRSLLDSVAESIADLRREDRL